MALARSAPAWQQVRDGLAAAQPVAGRQVSHRLSCGAVLIDDSYNANPGSLDAAIDCAGCGGGEAWLVLGDMRELGADEARRCIARQARVRAAPASRACMRLARSVRRRSQRFGEGARHFDSHAALARIAGATSTHSLRAGAAHPVKGSRGSAMDRIVKALLQHDAAKGKGERRCCLS